MPSSYTTRNRLNKQATGENINVWGDTLNTGALDLADAALDGWTTKALTSNYVLTSANGTSDEARSRVLKFTGTGAYQVTIPAVEKNYIVWNGTSGALTVTTGAGTSLVIDPSDILLVICDGSNVKTLGYGGMSIKEYVAAATLSDVELPAQAGNGGKFIQTDGTNATWQAPAATDLSDYSTTILGVQIALAVAL